MEKGFTLLEVLIASVILFATIATASAVFSSAVTANIAASSHVKSGSYGAYIFEHVRYMVRQDESSGQGHWDGVSFSWQVVSSESAAINAVSMGATQTGSIKSVQLSKVNVNLSSGNRTQSFELEVTSW